LFWKRGGRSRGEQKKRKKKRRASATPTNPKNGWGTLWARGVFFKTWGGPPEQKKKLGGGGW